MLHASVDSIEQHRRLGGVEASRVASFIGAAVALGNLDHFETSAIIMGYIREATAQFGAERFTEMVDVNELKVREALGEARVADLKAQGATLDIIDALALLRAAERDLDR
jgi:hypothetical protein